MKIAVLDVGKSNVKSVLVDMGTKRETAVRVSPPCSVPSGIKRSRSSSCRVSSSGAISRAKVEINGGRFCAERPMLRVGHRSWIKPDLTGILNQVI